MVEIRHRWTDEEIVVVAKKYKHRGDWKRSKDGNDSAAYQTALRRPEVFGRATAHMTFKAHPYSGSYVIYAYEFTDNHAYVGHTFLPKVRHTEHMCKGPVHDHFSICSTYAYKILEEGLASPDDSGRLEGEWQTKYLKAGWTPLWSAKAGGIGSVAHNKWTKEAVLADAQKYKTKQEWIDKNQTTYRLAKREGWFDAASAHMPKRVLGIGVGRKVSQSAKDKMRQAKIGVKQSASHRRNRSVAVKEWWVRMNATPLGPP